VLGFPQGKLASAARLKRVLFTPSPNNLLVCKAVKCAVKKGWQVSNDTYNDRRVFKSTRPSN
ncbi:MAG TPA: hypothetical protein PKL82_03255, partial [Anaerolineaceae bacterium]|nr:hypothetical protein [Anaerolineaceae bacterium]